jgi:hypothetical protein
MDRHRFDPLSAALGVISLGAAAVVAGNAVLTTATYRAGWWVAVGALVLGLGLIPWPSRRSPSPAAPPSDAGVAGVADPSRTPGAGLSSSLAGPEEDPLERIEER